MANEDCNELDQLAAQIDGCPVFYAGLPRFGRNFTRDAILAALLFDDPAMMRNQLTVCGRHLGETSDPLTGEEPGKVYHEFQGMTLRERSTEFNGCDTTALFVLGFDYLARQVAESEVHAADRRWIERSVQYIQRHLQNGLFTEDPRHSETNRYALKVTYWKDSEILDRTDGEPVYPVIYTLAHAQNLAAVRAAARLLNDESLVDLALQMLSALHSLWDEERGLFFIGHDAKGAIAGTSSDALFLLYFLEPGDLPDHWLQGIRSRAGELETDAGYRTLSPRAAERVHRGYHSRTVWPFEQAFIHHAARGLGWNEVAAICERVVPWLDTAPEILRIGEEGRVEKGGCDPQLWTLAARHYFRTCGS